MVQDVPEDQSSFQHQSRNIPACGTAADSVQLDTRCSDGMDRVLGTTGAGADPAMIVRDDLESCRRQLVQYVLGTQEKNSRKGYPAAHAAVIWQVSHLPWLVRLAQRLLFVAQRAARDRRHHYRSVSYHFKSSGILHFIVKP
jgi:hypothetical protein